MLLSILITLGCGNESPMDPDARGMNPDASSQQTFTLTFTGLWSSTSHPTDYPSGAHFSPLIGTVHSQSARLWQDAHTATSGIQSMAETGGTSLLASEIDALISTGDAQEVLRGSGPSSEGTSMITFSTTAEFLVVTLITMIAPSPDWFVGIDSYPLRTPQGDWIDNAVVDLFAYDAGSDSGTDFSALDAPTIPKEAIGRLTGGDFDTRFATLTITRQ